MNAKRKCMVGHDDDNGWIIAIVIAIIIRKRQVRLKHKEQKGRIQSGFDLFLRKAIDRNGHNVHNVYIVYIH